MRGGEGTRVSRGRTLLMEGRCRFGVVHRHNGMTGAGSDRDAGPTRCSAPGSGLFLPGSVKASGSIGDDWRCTRCTTGLAAGWRWNARRRMSRRSHVRCLHQLFPFAACRYGMPFDVLPGIRVRQKADRAGVSGTGFGAWYLATAERDARTTTR